MQRIAVGGLSMWERLISVIEAWAKPWGILLIIAACSGLGFQLAWSYSHRIRQCRQIEQCLQRLFGEIRFHQLPLTEALRATGQAADHGFGQFLIGLADTLEICGSGSFYSHWQQELERYLEDSLLQEEQELLMVLGQELGELDLDAQVKALQRCLDQWRRAIEELQRQEEKHGRLYRGLGISAGCVLAILLW